jgi:hypothetical protein
MKRANPIFFVDYCGIREKDAFLVALSAHLAPRRNLVVLDGGAPATSSDGFIRVTAPKTMFRSKRRPLLPLSVNSRRVLSTPDLHGADEQLAELRRERHGNYRYSAARKSLAEAFAFTRRQIEGHQPDLVIVWNQFHPLSKAAQAAARNCGVPVAFVEFGLLPGTLNFDLAGQMGESDVVWHASEFNNLSVEPADREAAEAAIRSVRETQANRRIQEPLNAQTEILKQRANGRSIVFFAGHNDHASGTRPYDDSARKYHSPMFTSSREAAQHLADLAKRNDWFLLYKPHPFACRTQLLDDAGHMAVLSRDVDINACISLADCIVTTVSQTSYVAMMHQKPLVMVGYNQLRHSGCQYQADTIDEVETSIQKALAAGFTQVQYEAWMKHVARLLKHYLFTFPGSTKPLPCARSIFDLANLVEETAQSTEGVIHNRWV